jgi:queuine tRNA-ribosyltransferase
MSLEEAPDRAFEVLREDPLSAARLGLLQTRHGSIPTPIFMPVGTQATVKGLTPRQIHESGARIILGNTYHLNLRPGADLIAEMGGLHTFMGWDGPILTDSGGFQVFSLAKLRQITPEGIRFRSHLDGSEVFLSPSKVMHIQQLLGSDIAMVLDECPPWPAEPEVIAGAVERSLKWARQAIESSEGQGILQKGNKIFGIVQGGSIKELRQRCASELAAMDFPGYAIGGVSVGEPEAEMLAAVKHTIPSLPSGKPRYVMGVGTPPQLLRMIALGADMFDCVMPTREARHGTVYTNFGKINIKNSRYRNDPRPLDPSLQNEASTFSRAYLRHLFISGEILAMCLLSLHNIHFFLNLMEEARRHLEEGNFTTWSTEWIQQYSQVSEE